MTRTGGTAPFTWFATGLPDGLSMDAAGVITGTPTATGTFNPTVTVIDDFGASNARNYTVAINPSPSVATATLPDAFRGVAYSTTVSGTNGTPPYSWTATGLPAGLGISSSGTISGTPSVTGSFAVNVTLTDLAGATASQSLNLTIRTPLTLSKTPSPCEVENGVFTTFTVDAQRRYRPHYLVPDRAAVRRALVRQRDGSDLGHAEHGQRATVP